MRRVSRGLGLHEPRLLGRRGQHGPFCTQSSGHGRADRLGRCQPHRLPPGVAARREPAKPLRAAPSVLYRRGGVLSLRGDDPRGAHPLFDRGDSRPARADALDPATLRRAGAAVAACPHRGHDAGLPPFHPPVPLLRAGHALHAVPAGGLVLDGIDETFPACGPGGRRAVHGRSLVCQLPQCRLGPGHASRFLTRRPLPHPAEGGFPRCRPDCVADLRHPYLFCQGPDDSPVRPDGLSHGHRPHLRALCPAHDGPWCLRVSFPCS